MRAAPMHPGEDLQASACAEGVPGCRSQHLPVLPPIPKAAAGLSVGAPLLHTHTHTASPRPRTARRGDRDFFASMSLGACLRSGRDCVGAHMTLPGHDVVM